MTEGKRGGIHGGHRQRMRERLKTSGVSSFADHELLEMLLYNIFPRKDTNETAHKILDEFGGSLELLLNADPADLERRCGLNGNAAVLFSIVAELGKRSVYGKFKEKMLIDSSEIAGNYVKFLLSHEKRECFYAICLDAQSRLINAALVSHGIINQTNVYIRNVVEAVIKYNAVSVILAHNHPSGKLIPSESDIITTVSIIKVLNSIDVNVVDHIIVADDKYMSMADEKLIKNSI